MRLLFVWKPAEVYVFATTVTFAKFLNLVLCINYELWEQR